MKKYLSFAFLAVLLTGISGCIKHADAPPAGGVDPNLTVNYTIAQAVKQCVQNGNLPYKFTQNLIIAGVVVGNDSSGNIYKNIALEDSTGGIMLYLDYKYLYQDYPIGMRLFIKLNGLLVARSDSIYEIAYDSSGTAVDMPSTYFPNYIFPGKWNIAVAPKVVTIPQLKSNNSYQSELIELDNVEFQPNYVGKPFADGYTNTSGNLVVQDCSGNIITVYTSGYADFANQPAPGGNGKLLAIYGNYDGVPQLTIRDLGDLAGMTGTNCNGGVNGFLPLATLSAKYQGSPVTLPTGTIIHGTVISDKLNKNIDSNYVVIEDATGGICINFIGGNPFFLGAEVTVNISGAVLASNNGWLQVSQVYNLSATQTGTGNVTPNSTTLSKIAANPTAFESTLVQLSNASFSGQTTFNGTLSISDGSGASANFYTSPNATFVNTVAPSTPQTVTCIVEQNNGLQLQIRNLGDIQ